MILNIKKIESKFTEAKEKAKSKDSSILLSVTADIQLDFSSLLNLNLDGCKEKIYWSEPSNEFEFISWGSVLNLNVDQYNINSILKNTIDNRIQCDLGKDKTIPIFIGGQNFDIKRENKDIWNGFPQLDYKIPLIIILNQAENYSIAFNFIISKDSSKSNILNIIKNTIDAIHSHTNITKKKISNDIVSNKISPDYKKFSQRFLKIKDYINSSRIEKAVISDIVSYSLNENFPFRRFLMKLKKIYPKCTIFLYDYGTKGKYLGASPEKIFSLKNNKLEIDALAGSINRKNNKLDRNSNIEYILNDEKINDEHDIVVKDIIESLDELRLELNISKKNVLTLKDILHLKTVIKSNIKNFKSPFNILNSLSPTAALSGYPKKEGIDIINNIENYDRGWYTGAIGWIDNKFNCNFFAGLRSMFINKNKLYIYGGAGITKDSDESEEWNEVLYKINIIEELINGWQ